MFKVAFDVLYYVFAIGLCLSLLAQAFYHLRNSPSLWRYILGNLKVHPDPLLDRAMPIMSVTECVARMTFACSIIGAAILSGLLDGDLNFGHLKYAPYVLFAILVIPSTLGGLWGNIGNNMATRYDIRLAIRRGNLEFVPANLKIHSGLVRNLLLGYFTYDRVSKKWIAVYPRSRVNSCEGYLLSLEKVNQGFPKINVFLTESEVAELIAAYQKKAI